MRYIFIFLLTLSSFASASANNVACPGLDVIQQSATKLDDASFVNQAFIVNTQPHAIHTLKTDWFAVVYNVHAASAEEALILAKLAMQSVSRNDTVFANNFGGVYVCDYDYKKVELMSNDFDYFSLPFVPLGYSA